MKAARLDLAELGEELGEQLVRATDEKARATEQLFVGETLERVFRKRPGMSNVRGCLHVPTVHLVFSSVLRRPLASVR